MAYQDDVLALNPIAYWRLGEAGGAGTAQDATANNKDGTPTDVTFGMTGLLSSNADTAAEFNGSTSLIDCGDQTYWDNAQKTIVLWLKSTDFGAGYRGLAVRRHRWALYLIDNVAAVYDFTNNNGTLRGSMLNDNVRHMIALTYQSGLSSGCQVYIDGAPSGAAFTYTHGSATPDPLTLGHGNFTGQHLTGIMDEVSIHNAVLTSTEIANLWASGTNATPPPPAPPPTPTGLTATAVSTSQINLAWSHGTPNGIAIDSYQLQMSLNGTSGWVEIGIVDGGDTTFSHSNLNQNTQYWYRLRARDAEGDDSAWSSIASDTTDATAALTFSSITVTPGSNIITPGSNPSTAQFQVTWTTNVSATRQVRWGTVQGGAKPNTTPHILTPNTLHSVTVTGLPTGTIIWFEVGGAAA